MISTKTYVVYVRDLFKLEVSVFA